MYLDLLLLGIGIAGSIFFSGAETGFITWNVLKVKHRALAGDIVARWGLYLVGRRDQLISAILIGNNIANIGTSLAFVALIDALLPSLPPFFARIPSPESWILTPLLLLLGEMLPKSLFRIYPFRLTIRVIPFMMVFYFITYPVTSLFSLVVDIKRKKKPQKSSSFAARVREEIVLIASEGSKTGSLFRSADQFIEAVMLLDDKKTGDVISPEKLNGAVFRDDMSAGEVKRGINSATTVILIADKNDVVNGYATLSDLAATPDTTKIGTLKRRIRKINKNQPVLSVFRSVKAHENALVEIIDDDGRSLGITNTVRLIAETFEKFQHPV